MPGSEHSAGGGRAEFSRSPGRQAAHLELTLSSDPANVSLVREVIIGLAAAVGLGDADLDDVLTAVSEAVNNVVQHAYDELGPVWVELLVRRRELQAVVRDAGRGIVLPQDDPISEEVRGVGLAAIEAFSSRMWISAAPGQGTEVRMSFDAACRRPPPEPELAPAPAPGPLLDSDSRITFRPARLADPALTRLVTWLAARAGFTIDRLSDAELLAGSVASAAGALALDALHAVAAFDRRTVELQLGPLPPGHGRGLIGPVVERLANATSITATPAGEMVSVRIDDSRRPA